MYCRKLTVKQNIHVSCDASLLWSKLEVYRDINSGQACCVTSCAQQIEEVMSLPAVGVLVKALGSLVVWYRCVFNLNWSSASPKEINNIM